MLDRIAKVKRLAWLVPAGLFVLFASIATFLRTNYTLMTIDKWDVLSASFTSAIDGSLTWEAIMATSTHAFTPVYPALIGFLQFISQFLVGYYDYLAISTVVSLAATAGSVVIAALLSRSCVVTSLYATATAMMFDAAGWQETMPLTVFASSFYLLAIMKDKASLALPAGILLVFTREILWPLLLVPPVISLLRANRTFRDLFKVTLIYTVIPALIYAAWAFGSNAVSLMELRYERVAWWNWQRSPANLAVAFFTSTGTLSLVLFRANRFSRDDMPVLAWVAIFLLSRLVMDGPFLYQYFEPMILAGCLLWKHGGKERHAIIVINVLLIFAIVILAVLSWLCAIMNFMTSETVLFGPPFTEG